MSLFFIDPSRIRPHQTQSQEDRGFHSPMAKNGIPSSVELNFPSDMKKIPAAVTLAMQMVSTPRRPRKGFPLRQSRMELEMVAARSTRTRLTSTSPLDSMPVWWKSRQRLKEVSDWM